MKYVNSSTPIVDQSIYIGLFNPSGAQLYEGYAPGRWVMSLAQTLGKHCGCPDRTHLANARRVSIPHPRVPLLKEGRGIVGTRGGVSSTMPILVVFLHSVYKNRDTSIV